MLNCILSFGSNAQTTEPKNELRIKSSVMGSVIYPGFRLGTEKVYQYKYPEMTKKWAYMEKSIGLNTGMYHHKTFHTNYFITAEWQSRKFYPNGLFIDSSLGFGGSRTILDGNVYIVSDDGHVSQKECQTYNYGLITLGGSIGYTFCYNNKIQAMTFLKPSILFMFPYNSLAFLRPVVELGFAVDLF